MAITTWPPKENPGIYGFAGALFKIRPGFVLFFIVMHCALILPDNFTETEEKWSLKRFGAFPNQQTSLNRMQADPSAPKLDDGAGLITAGCLLMLPPGPVMLLAASDCILP